MSKTFGSFSLPVRARRIARQRQYSDVIVTSFVDGVANRLWVPAEPRKGMSEWEPEVVIRKVKAI